MEVCCLEVRKTQKLGRSTLVVSLPKSWVEETGLKPGEIVTIERREDGSLKIYPGFKNQRKNKVTKCTIFSDSCKKPKLVTRLLTGCYVTGHDAVSIVSKHKLKQEYLKEIQKLINRLSGIGVIEQTPKKVVIQCFVDPSKFPIYGLFKRMHSIISVMFEKVMTAFSESKPDLLDEVFHLEDEVDRIYWFVVRQLIISLHNKEIRKEVGIESIDHIIGNRTIAKNLELIADNIEKMAKAILSLEPLKCSCNKELIKELLNFSGFVGKVLDKTMEALYKMDIYLASEAIEEADLIKSLSSKVSEEIIKNEKKTKVVANLENFKSNLEQIPYLCKVIVEIVINRVLEKSSDVCKIETITK